MLLDPPSMLSVSGDASAQVSAIEYKSELGLWFKSMLPYMLLNLILFVLAIYLLLTSESIDPFSGSWSTTRSEEL